MEKTSFQHKTALITGASSGIGKAIATEFAKQGTHLVLVSRNQDKLNQLQKELANRYAVKINVIPFDLSKSSSALHLYQRCQSGNIKVDILVNNAGFGMATEREFIDPETLESMIILQTSTITVLSSLFSSDMVKRKEGYILNISSICATTPAASTLTYSAVKSYILQYSRYLHYELKDKNIVVTCCLPGATNTSFDVHSELPIPNRLRQFYTSPDFVAIRSIEGLRRKKRIVLPGGQTKFLHLIGRCIPDQMIYKCHKKFWVEKRNQYLSRS
jgi:short-subunit dehydrogenase